MIIWLTGQPNSGKTTIANHLKTKNSEFFVIDGDNLRDITKNYDYTQEGRIKNIIDAQTIASYINSLNKNVVVAMVSPYRNLREQFKSKQNVLEVYLTSDRKGKESYKVENYEAPINNFHHINTDLFTVEEVCDKILKLNNEQVCNNIYMSQCC